MKKQKIYLVIFKGSWVIGTNHFQAGLVYQLTPDLFKLAKTMDYRGCNKTDKYSFSPTRPMIIDLTDNKRTQNYFKFKEKTRHYNYKLSELTLQRIYFQKQKLKTKADIVGFANNIQFKEK